MIDMGLDSDEPMVAAGQAYEAEAAWGAVERGHTLCIPSYEMCTRHFHESWMWIMEKVLGSDRSSYAELAPRGHPTLNEI